MPTYEEYRAIFVGRRLPLAFVDLDLLAENCQQIAAQAGSKHIRLASKSIRAVAILRRIFAASPVFQGIMAYSPREAIFLAEQGFADILLGYPIWHAQDIADLARANAGGASITLMIDSVAHVEQIETCGAAAGVQLPVCLDIDMALDLPGLHFGVWRSAVRTADQAKPIVAAIRRAPHVRLDGIMGYEAQVAGLGDNLPGQRLKNLLVRQLKRRSIRLAAERRAAIVALLHAFGMEPRFVNGGGTGSLRSTAREEAVTEVTVGSGLYSPGLFDYYRDFRYQPAAGYAIEIVRRPQPTIYTCLGGGYIASGGTGPEKQPKPYLPEGARLDSLEGAGEVQTPIRYAGPIALSLGDPIFLRHSKAGELCERFDTLLLVSKGQIVDEIPTYRGAGQCFL